MTYMGKERTVWHCT